MEGLSGLQYYPKQNQTYMQRVQRIIDAYYENDSSQTSIGADTPSDDVDRLSLNLSTFPRCINEYVDKLLVAELSVNLPQDDIDDLAKKHDSKCAESISNVKKAITSIETYATMTNTPHLFMKDEIGVISDMSDNDILELVVKVVIDMYGEENIHADEYIQHLEKERQKLDNSLLSLDYD